MYGSNILFISVISSFDKLIKLKGHFFSIDPKASSARNLEKEERLASRCNSYCSI